jgi:hypothetical protein
MNGFDFLITLWTLGFSFWGLTTVEGRIQPRDAQFERVTDEFNISIQSPYLQAQRTSKLILGNGIQVYIVSDPGILKSGAALSIETGSWRDPEGVSGLGISTNLTG